MARRKLRQLSVIREPNGRRARAPQREFAPTQVKRLREAALAGMQGEEWGSELGRLFLADKIGPELYAAGKRWREHAARYHGVIGAPLPPPALAFERGGAAAAPDPDTPAGERQIAREAQAMREMREAHAVLLGAGRLAERVVRSVCEENAAPCGTRELDALCRGLLWLAQFWGFARRGR